MRKKKTFKEKLVAVFLMAAVTITMIPAGLAFYAEDTQAATTYSYSMTRPSVKIKGHKVHITTFTVSGLGLKGSCCQVGTDAKTGKTTATKLSNTDIRTKLMYYYGYQKGYLGKTNMDGFLLGRALSWESGNKRTYPATSTEVKNFIKAMPSSVTVPNRFECYICNPTNGAQDFIAYKMNPPAYISLKKTSANALSTAAGSGYSFEGIEYSVYNSSGGLVGKLTCNASGSTNTLTLDTGTYTVRETKTNKWYKLNSQAYSKTLTTGQTWTVSASDNPQTGTLQIKKKVKGKYTGDLAFAFRLTNTANPNIVYNTVTDKVTGEAAVDVIEGSYRCEEVLSEGTEMIDMTGVQTGTVKIGETFTFERENMMPASGTLLVNKSTDDGGSPVGFRFRVTGQLYNQGTITAEKLIDEADPSVTDYDEAIYQLDEWKAAEKDIEALNKAAADKKTGSMTVTMTNALKYKGDKGVGVQDLVDNPEGKIKKDTIINDGGKTFKSLEDTAYEIIYEETAETGETENKKVDAEKTGEKIRELLAGESFEEVDISDINLNIEVKVNLQPVQYVYNSDEPKQSGYETDTDKQLKNQKSETEEKEKYKLKHNDFDWFGAATAYQEIKNGELTGNQVTTIETGDNGAAELSEGITSGTFTVTEEMTDAQKARYRQPQSQTKEIKQQNGSAAFVFSFENKARWTGAGLIKTSDDGKVSGIAFKLEGTNKNGEKIEREAVTDADGKINFGKLYAGEYIVSETGFDSDKYENNNKLEGYKVPAQKLTITGDETSDIEVKFHNTPLKSLYLTKVDKESQLFLENAVFALYENKKELAMFRLILNDYGQAEIEMIRCDAAFSTDQDNGATTAEPQKAEGNEYNFAVIRGLKEGKNYTIKEITAPAGYAASVDKAFVFEDGMKLIMENAAPEIATSAVDKATKKQMSDAEGMVTIVDTVFYSNLCPGHKYLLSGVLAQKPEENRTVEQIEQDAEIIEIVKDAKGNEVTAQKEFVPKTENGTVDLEFRFDASLLDGKQVVAMEQLVDPALTGINGVITVVASHEDMEDQAQTIYFPKVSTKASADDTGKSITEADNYVMITDKVDYSNVIAGKIYEITGTLMDKETGKPLLSNGNKITSTVVFRADKEGPVFAGEGETLKEENAEEHVLVSGTIDLKFSFDGSALNGKRGVVFEKLFTGKSLVGEHSDINDADQTVFFPGIETTANTNGTDTVSDKVEYRNLLAGEKYIMKGQLMDKSTGKELIIDGRDFTAQTEFIPEKSDGSVIVNFPVNVKDLKGKTAVVFETCSLVTDTEFGPVETEVISHKDINNKAQTVSFDVPQTGQRGPWMLLFPIGLVTAAAISFLLRNLRKAGKV